MPLFTRQPSSSLQTERLSHYSIPLSCANINYQSASSDMPPSKPIRRPWRESATNAQRESNSGEFLSGALSSLSSPSSSRSWKET